MTEVPFTHSLVENLATLADCCLWRVDPEGAFVYCSPHVSAILGYSPGELIGKPVSDLVCPGSGQEFLDRIHSPVDSSTPEDGLSLFMKHGDGSCSYIRAQLYPEITSDGKCLGIAGIFQGALLHSRPELRVGPRVVEKVLESMDLAALSMSAQGEIYWTNNALAEALGYSRHDLIGSNLSVLEPDDANVFDTAKNLLESALEEGALNRVVNFKKSDGNLMTALVKFHVVRDGDGETLAVSGYLNDITRTQGLRDSLKTLEVKYAQLYDELRATHEELLEAQRVGRIGSWTLDIESGDVYWTEQLYRMFGLDGRDNPPNYAEHSKLFTPESWEKLDKCLANTVARGVPYELELQQAGEFGDGKWMLARGEPVLDGSGKVAKLRGVAMDITERKRAEADLAAAEKIGRFGTWTWDVEGDRTEWSDGLYRLFGLDPSDNSPSFAQHSELFRPESWEKLHKAVEHTLASGEPYEIEVELANVSADERWLLVRAEPTLNGDGKVFKLRGMAIDITDRKRLDRILKEKMHEMSAMFDATA